MPLHAIVLIASGQTHTHTVYVELLAVKYLVIRS